MTLPPGSTITSYVASICHAAYRLEECYQAEEDDSISFSSTTRPPIISNLDKISVLLNGLPSAYQPVIVNITGTPLSSLIFEDVVTRLMNEEGRLRNIVSPTTTPSSLPTHVMKPMPPCMFQKANHSSPPLRRLSDISNVEELVIFALNAPLLMKMLSMLQPLLMIIARYIIMMKKKISPPLTHLLMKLKLRRLGNYLFFLFFYFLLLPFPIRPRALHLSFSMLFSLSYASQLEEECWNIYLLLHLCHDSRLRNRSFIAHFLPFPSAKD
jgi:hypothetical protein